jgi:hypothetical protein
MRVAMMACMRQFRDSHDFAAWRRPAIHVCRSQATNRYKYIATVQYPQYTIPYNIFFALHQTATLA